MQDYLRQTVTHFQLKDGSASKSSTASCTHSSSADASSTQDRSLAFATSGRQLAALRREAEALKSEVCASQEETATLKTTARRRAAEIHELQRKWTTSREEKDLVAWALKISRERLKTANATTAAIQHTNFYKRIKQREIALKQKEATVEQRERQCGQRRQRVEELKKKLKTYLSLYLLGGLLCSCIMQVWNVVQCVTVTISCVWVWTSSPLLGCRYVFSNCTVFLICQEDVLWPV